MLPCTKATCPAGSKSSMWTRSASCLICRTLCLIALLPLWSTLHTLYVLIFCLFIVGKYFALCLFLSNTKSIYIYYTLGVLQDAIVHVCDGSHPDLALQREHTMKTLGSFKHMAPGFLDRVITVRNKCDKIPEDSDFQDDLPVSAKSGQGIIFKSHCYESLHFFYPSTGMKFLEQIIEAIIVKTTNRQMMVLRVPSGGEEAKWVTFVLGFLSAPYLIIISLRWLYKETAVCDVEADPEDGQFLRFKVLLSDVQLARFKSYFLKGRRTG